MRPEFHPVESGQASEGYISRIQSDVVSRKSDETLPGDKLFSMSDCPLHDAPRHIPGVQDGWMELPVVKGVLQAMEGLPVKEVDRRLTERYCVDH